MDVEALDPYLLQARRLAQDQVTSQLRANFDRPDPFLRICTPVMLREVRRVVDQRLEGAPRIDPLDVIYSGRVTTAYIVAFFDALRVARAELAA